MLNTPKTTSFSEAIANGQHNGEFVYICDIRHSGNPFDKFVRHVPPQRVFIRSNSEAPANKRIYYSESHFVKLKRNGDPGATIIPLFDNTGYRSSTGTAVQVFLTMQEANDMYQKQRKVIASDMSSIIASQQANLIQFERESIVS